MCAVQRIRCERLGAAGSDRRFHVQTAIRADYQANVSRITFNRVSKQRAKSGIERQLGLRTADWRRASHPVLVAIRAGKAYNVTI